MRPSILTAALLLTLLAASPVRANQVLSEDCDSNPTDRFAVTDSVCVMGDVDYTCPDGIIDLPGADVYVVPRGAAPFSTPGIHFDTLGGAGGFWNIAVLMPELVPGTYDLILDEHCDGVFDTDDVRVDEAFVVEGELMCTMPPGEPMNPGLASGALCRGACGPDCPTTCSPAPPVMACEEDVDLCEHVECSYTGVTCGTHEGCRVHDDCYDACAAAGAGMLCWRECDLECIREYGPLCYNWMNGHGPYDSTVTYYGPPTTSAPMTGLCSGPC